MTQSFRVAQMGDAALIVALAEGQGPDLTLRAVAIAEALRHASLPGVIDVVPTSHSVGVYLDPLRVPVDIESRVARIAADAKAAPARKGATVDVPVCYGGAFGPDLNEVAAFAGLTADEVTSAHTSVSYRVQMLGFTPGFAYMTTVDSRIAMPRRAIPRVTVAAGSVGIAGAQTGVYPVDSPGGWQIIGRTPLRVSNFDRPQPFLFAAGDTVRFRAIDAATFAKLAAEHGG